MTTDFYIVSGTTVPEEYYWDIGNPLETTPTYAVADSTTEYISGYAPGLKVVFSSNINDLIFSGQTEVSSTYIWNFGDYYNNKNNEITFECKDSTVEHTYIMPGKYTVSLTNIQSKTNIPVLDPVYDGICPGERNIGWYWNNFLSGNQNQLTWNEETCFGVDLENTLIRPKRWDIQGRCFQKYCANWSWKDVNLTGRNPVFWWETWRGGDYGKRWEYEANNYPCAPADIPQVTVDVEEQIATKPFIVEVLEKPPVAKIYNQTATLTGYSPYPLKLSPIHVKPGSFPIDQIDWDPGDGTPIKTVSRYSTPDLVYFSYNGMFFSDPRDPRNYDFIYTLKRNINTYPVFYPSLTCYSACTNTSDSCSITVGPIFLEPQKQDIHLLKAKNTIKGDFYGIETNNNITIMSTLAEESVVTAEPTAPKNIIRHVTNPDFITYFGNTGKQYPQTYTPGCEYIPSEPDLFYLLTEGEDSSSLSAIFLEDTTLLYK